MPANTFYVIYFTIVAVALGGLVRAGLLLRSELSGGQGPKWRRVAGILAFAALVMQTLFFSSLFSGHAMILLDAFGVLRLPLLIAIIILVCAGTGVARWWTLASYVVLFFVSSLGSWDV